ncbi:MAG: histidine phosphatase family protein [Planctomycetales bacterium]|nr:histidine phosphatase family protein [Planctomycetales bacterium]
MLRIVLVRPGCTEFDEQQRIQGSLNLPLSLAGVEQAVAAARDLGAHELAVVYVAPEEAAVQTAELLAKPHQIKVKELEGLANLDHGLWHGKLLSEVRQQQPKVYRQWQEHPETVCPPGGETLQAARERARKALLKIIKKHKKGMVAIVVSEPMASMVQSLVCDAELGDLWQGSLNCGQWVVLDVMPERAGAI